VPATELRDLRQRLEGSFAGRCVTSLVALQGLDRAMVIASQAFTALIPLLILGSAVLPRDDGTGVADEINRRLGLTGDAAGSVETVFASSGSGSVGVVSVLLLVFSGVSLTRRLQRMYLQAWRLAPLKGVRGPLHATMGLAALLVAIVLLSLVRTIARALPLEWALGVPLSFLASVVLWTSIPWLLLDRRVAWRRLIPGGALTGAAASLYGVATTIYMPRLVEDYSERYGLFGVTISLVGWLLCISFIVVAATVVAAELDRAPEPWARRVRGWLGIEPAAAPASLVRP
jgi:membrane protein